jgi:hypothetical protein
MSIYSVHITNEKPASEGWPTYHFSKAFSKEEYEGILELCDRAHFLNPQYFTTSKDDKREFFKGFFLPGFFQTINSTSSVANKIFEGVYKFLWDLLTLPLRTITLPYALLQDENNKNNHPFHQFLVQNKASDELLAADFLYVDFYSHTQNPENWTKEYSKTVDLLPHCPVRV